MGERSWAVNVESVIGVTVMEVSGRLSAADATDFSQIMHAELEHGYPVAIDLRRTRLIDASIARTLRQAHASYLRRGMPFAVTGAAGQPLAVLEVLGMAKALGTYRTVDETTDELRAFTLPESIDATVHELLSRAHAFTPEDHRRRRLEQEAITAALPLARTLARRYERLGEPHDDLMQVAALGVIRAVRQYDPTVGRGFMAYAVPTVAGELRKHFRDFVWTVRPPRRLQEIRTEALAAASDVAQLLGRDPSLGDIAAHIRIDVSDVEQAMLTSSGLRPSSLDAPVGIDAEHTLYDIVGVAETGSDLVEFRMSIAPLIAALPSSTRAILALRFGSDMTQTEIAAQIGTSQMHVSRILSATFKALREALFVEE